MPFIYFRWRCHDTSGGYLQYSPEKVALFIKATAVLHNMCRMAKLPDPEVDVAEEDEAIPQPQGLNPGLHMRNHLIQRFFAN